MKLENGVNIVGRKNALEVSVEQIMKECGLDSDAPTVVLQHRTKGLSQLDGVADLDMRAYAWPPISVFRRSDAVSARHFMRSQDVRQDPCNCFCRGCRVGLPVFRLGIVTGLADGQFAL